MITVEESSPELWISLQTVSPNIFRVDIKSEKTNENSNLTPGVVLVT
jgi:hypothetical protein